MTIEVIVNKREKALSIAGDRLALDTSFEDAELHDVRNTDERALELRYQELSKADEDEAPVYDDASRVYKLLKRKGLVTKEGERLSTHVNFVQSDVNSNYMIPYLALVSNEIDAKII